VNPATTACWTVSESGDWPSTASYSVTATGVATGTVTTVLTAYSLTELVTVSPHWTGLTVQMSYSRYD